jgi:hypothetical protein
MNPKSPEIRPQEGRFLQNLLLHRPLWLTQRQSVSPSSRTTLEDAEAIRNLKARYAALCDNQYDADGIAMLFTEDAVWESPGLGRFEGREAIRGFSGVRRGFSPSRSITA